MTLQVGVKAIIINKNKEILLLEKNTEKYPGYTGKWDIPGGRIDPTVSLFENLKREIKEETGMDMTNLSSPVLLGAQDILKADYHVVRLTYVFWGEGEVRLSLEHLSYSWIPLDTAKNTEGIDSYLLEVMYSQRFKDIVSRGTK